MSQNPLDMLEARLETFVEGAFARLYQRGISARDIAILLLRAMEDNAANPPAPGALPIAPDLYSYLPASGTCHGFTGALPRHAGAHGWANRGHQPGNRLSDERQTASRGDRQSRASGAFAFALMPNTAPPGA